MSFYNIALIITTVFVTKLSFQQNDQIKFLPMSQVWYCISLVPALMKPSKVGLCACEVSWTRTMHSRPARAT